ncbi:MAG: hypothetical protein NTY01_25805 [Verrucomicrobia bacterium]|nr:hypothetical protein [Verrucomicrobiota bacterium]
MRAAQRFAGPLAEQCLQLHARHQFLHVLARENNLPLLVQDQDVIQHRVEQFGDQRLPGHGGGLALDRLNGRSLSRGKLCHQGNRLRWVHARFLIEDVTATVFS